MRTALGCRERLKSCRLVLAADVAFLVCRGPTQQRYLRCLSLVEEPLPPCGRDHFNQVLACGSVHTPTGLARVHIGSEPDMRQNSRLLSRHCAIELGDDTLGQVVSLQFIRDDQLHEQRLRAVIPADHTLHQARVSEPTHTLRLKVAKAGGVENCQAPRVPVFQEPLLDGR